MSNELNTPKMLYCPADSTHDMYATNFGGDLKNKISYFIGLDSTPETTNTFLSGDENFILNNSPVEHGIINVASNASLTWDTSRHVYESQGWFKKARSPRGNILLGDDSVQTATFYGLQNLVHQTGLATNRLAIP